MELARRAGGSDPLHHRLDVADDPLGILVATHHRIAVLAVIGSSPRTRAETGVTAATGSAERMMKSPKVAFQKPITDHGRVTANSSTRMKSTTLKPPARARRRAAR